MGGMARRATLIDSIRETHSGSLLVVDAGNTLMGTALSLQNQGRAVLEGLDQMGYDALGVGTGEVLKGLEVLLQRASEADLAIVSANLVYRDTQEPVLQPYVTIERQATRYAVIGISATPLLQGLEATWPGVTVLPADQVLAEYVEAVRNQVDVVVVLSQLGLDADLALAEAVDGIDVVVGGGTQVLLEQPRIVGNTAIVQVGYDGEWLGQLEFAPDSQGRNEATYEVLYMRGDVPEAPQMNELLHRYRAEATIE